jgi:hypothetical protein
VLSSGLTADRLWYFTSMEFEEDQQLEEEYPYLGGADPDEEPAWDAYGGPDEPDEEPE